MHLYIVSEDYSFGTSRLVHSAFGHLTEASYLNLLSFKYGYFSLKNTSLHFKRPLLTLWSHMDSFFMDGCIFFLFLCLFVLKFGFPYKNYYKPWRTKNIFKYISDCVRLKEDIYIYLYIPRTIPLTYDVFFNKVREEQV